MTTLAPALASASTIARPMPLLPPVTTATLPPRLIAASSSRRLGRCDALLACVLGDLLGDRLAHLLDVAVGGVAAEDELGRRRVRIHRHHRAGRVAAVGVRSELQ